MPARTQPPRRAFDSSSARNALKLKLAEIASTPMPMRSIKSSGETACVADPRSGFENNADPDPRHSSLRRAG